MSDEVKSKRPSDSKFKQQNLPAWRPILTPRAVVITFFTIGAIFIPIGAVVLDASEKVIEVSSSNYDAPVSDGGCCLSNCDSADSSKRVDRNPCTIEIEVDEKMSAPIYMYYKLTNFYQNHRRYVKSRDDMQLRGTPDLGPSSVKTNCEYRYEYEGDDKKDTEKLNVISPCGLIAWSLFNDSFTIAPKSGGSIDVTEKGIAWSTDVDHKFKNAKDGSTGLNFPPFARYRNTNCDEGLASEMLSADKYTDCVEATNAAQDHWEDKDLPRESSNPGLCFRGSGYCAEDEHFIVWMRTAGLPSFRKLYLKIEEDLEPGTYEVTIDNGVVDGQKRVNPHTRAEQTSLYPTGIFRGQKYVVLSTTGWIGGKNNFLGVAYIIVGAVCVALALAFLLKDRCTPRDPGTAQYINMKNSKGGAADK